MSKCTHLDRKVIEIRRRAQGADDIETYSWCKQCGTLFNEFYGTKEVFIPENLKFTNKFEEDKRETAGKSVCETKSEEAGNEQDN